jgi:HK97 family phage major capsid protein
MEPNNMATSELRAKQHELLVDAEQVRSEITNETPAERVVELEARFDAIMAEHDGLNERIEREERLENARAQAEEREERARSQRPRGEDRSVNGGNRNEAPSEIDAFRSFLQWGARGVSEEERAVLRALRPTAFAGEQRAQSLTDAEGGYTVPQGFMPELIQSMKAWGPMLDPGITRELVTSSGNQIEIPTTNDTANVGVRLAENTAATSEGDVVFGQKLLDAYKYSSGPIKVSRELLQDSAFDMGAVLNELMGVRIARKVNTDLTTGDGSGDPNGIVTASTLGKTAAGVAAITADELIDLYHSVDPAYRADPSCRFMLNDSTLAAVRKLKDGQGQYLINGLRDGAGMINLAGIAVPYSINQAMASLATGNKTVLFGAFNKYIVRRVREFVVRRSDELYLEADQAVFVGFARFDGELLDTAAVKHLIQA